MMDFLFQTWPWYVAGPILSLVMLSLIYFGENFGLSNNLRTMCAVGGAGKYADFFKINKRKQFWNLAFVVGSVLGGFIAIEYLSSHESSICLSENTLTCLADQGFQNIGQEYLPSEIFGLEKLTTFSGLSILLLGGLLVGFGARYAGGCTSGHAISGLSDLQVPSLIAVSGFFIGGLLMVHLVMPFII